MFVGFSELVQRSVADVEVLNREICLSGVVDLVRALGCLMGLLEGL